MNIVVMGAGVIGVTSAYYLAKSGHQVTVVDRQPVAANETSFANAGLVAPGHSYTWSSPRAPRILLKSLFRDDQALRLRLRADPRMWSWCLKFLANCTAEKARINTTRKVKLCRYSQQALNALVADTGVAYDGLKGGLLYLYRSPESFARGSAHMRILTDNGLDLRLLGPAEIAKVDPSLEGAADRFAGAIYAPTDESGDANLFTRNLAEKLQAMGVAFRFSTAIRRIETEAGRVSGLDTDQGRLTADLYVLSLGCYSPFLAGPLGIRLPIYPVKGYSLTLPIRGNRAPSIGGVDEDKLVAYARFGNRLRLTATADFAGYDVSHRPDDFRTMLATSRELFADAADYDKPSYWAGLRPMTPEGTPIIGATRYKNLWLNTGHGHMGWTMSCGSGRVLADLIQGRRPELDLEGILPEAA
jgi:D-amino-acid dehydrogenase